MSLYRRALKYTKPLIKIDEKISHLEEAMMTTSNMYVTGQHVDAQPQNDPTHGEIPDASLGDLGDLDNFEQNEDSDNVDQLSANDAEGTSVPVTEVQDTSDFDFPSGVSARAMARHGRAETGQVYGFIDSRNVFNEIFVIGGLRPSGYGESGIIDAGLDWWHANIEGKTVVTVGWKCYNPPRLQDALYTPHATNVGPGGNYNLHTNSLLFVKNQNFMTDAGNPHRPASFTLLSRNGLGDPNYYPGPVTNVSPEALNYLLARLPRNAADFSTMNVRGPHQPIKYYPGMGFGPSGPVRGGPGGFQMTPQPRLANSYEPDGEVLSEDLTKDDFARLNKYVKDHPEELEYAFKRYPASDPRLSQLNFKMDEMMRASDEYVQKHFPENQRLFKKIQKSIKRSIKLTDPKTFKDVDTPSFKKLLSVDYVNEVGPPKKKPRLKNRNKKTAARFIKKPVEKKKPLYLRKKKDKQ